MAADLALLALYFGRCVWTYLAGTVVAAWRFSRRRVTPPPVQPPVSVLKPLYGAEPELYENLLSFVDQDYPELQIVFGVRSDSDGALPVARRVIAARPGRDIALVIDSRASGRNLKVANLNNMLPAARHDILVFADSDMRVGRDYLAAVTAPLCDPAIGLVTCLYKGVPNLATPLRGLWSRLGALHINYGFLPAALLGEAMGTGDGCFGATIVLRRAVLDRIGGLAAVRDELADDHRIGTAVREAGFATALSPYLVATSVSEKSLKCLWQHELRWARTVRLMAPVGFAGSIVTHTVALALLVGAAERIQLDLARRVPRHVLRAALGLGIDGRRAFAPAAGGAVAAAAARPAVVRGLRRQLFRTQRVVGRPVVPHRAERTDHC